MLTLEELYRRNPMLALAALSRIPRRVGVEGSLIMRGLYQGQAPPAGPFLRALGIDTIILCAEEWQPPHQVDPLCAAVLGYKAGSDPYPGVEKYYAPAADDFNNQPPAHVVDRASKAAVFTAHRVLQGRTVFVSCWAGKNRSGFVTTLAMHGLTGLPGALCVALLRRARPQALTNPQFVSALAKIQQTQAAPPV